MTQPNTSIKPGSLVYLFLGHPTLKLSIRLAINPNIFSSKCLSDVFLPSHSHCPHIITSHLGCKTGLLSNLPALSCFSSPARTPPTGLTCKCQIKISQMPLIIQLPYPKVHCVLFLMALDKDSFVCFPGLSLRSRFHLAYLTSFSSISNLLLQLAPSKLHKAHLFPSH